MHASLAAPATSAAHLHELASAPSAAENFSIRGDNEHNSMPDVHSVEQRADFHSSSQCCPFCLFRRKYVQKLGAVRYDWTLSHQVQRLEAQNTIPNSLKLQLPMVILLSILPTIVEASTVSAQEPIEKMDIRLAILTLCFKAVSLFQPVTPNFPHMIPPHFAVQANLRFLTERIWSRRGTVRATLSIA